MENEKNITINELAVMIKKGFDETAKQADMDLRFDKVDKRFDRVEARLDRIEKFLLEDHRIRIEHLELQIKEFREAIALK